MRGMPVGQKEEASCGGIPMRGAAVITMAVVFFILFFEMVVEDLLMSGGGGGGADLDKIEQRLDLLEMRVEARLAGVDGRVVGVDGRLARLEQTAAVQKAAPQALPPAGAAPAAPAAALPPPPPPPPQLPPPTPQPPPPNWWQSCGGARQPPAEAPVQPTAAVSVTAAEEADAAKTCCHNALNDQCVRQFDAADAERFRMTAGLCPAGGTDVLTAVRADCLKAARLAACGDAAPTKPDRKCPKKRNYCAAKTDTAIGEGYDIHPSAAQRRDSFMQCLTGLPDHPDPPDLIRCLTSMQAPITCKHLEGYGAVDGSKVCITPALLAPTCTVYSIGVGYIWQVENEWADYQPNCKFIMFDPTPEAGPHEHVDFSAIPSSVYTGQIRQSAGERHRNVLMMHTGIADSDHVGLFANHFVKGAGVQTAFLTMHSAVSLYGRVDHHVKPDYLKLDVEVRSSAAAALPGRRLPKSVDAARVSSSTSSTS